MSREAVMFFKTHHGAGYRHYVHAVVEKKRARGYLEIGVRNGETLAMIDAPSIGVDPAFALTHDVIGRKPKLLLFQTTSDIFFRDNDPRRLLESPIDVTFLDGLHQFEYLLRDVINAEAISHRDSVIMLDDCLPLHSEMTERVFKPEDRSHAETARMWTGDVWKVVSILKKYRPDLHLVATDTQPTGNVSLTNLDPSSTVLRDNFYRIVREYIAAPQDDEALEAYYDGLEIRSTSDVMDAFEASLFIGP